jgi:hypothetical protein
MPNAIRRTFTVFDAIVLVGAVAVPLPAIREAFRLAKMFNWMKIDGKDYLINFVAFTGSSFLAAFTIALVLLAFRRPKPTIRRVLMQPGLVACIAATAGMGYNAILALSRAHFHYHPLNLSVSTSLWSDWIVYQQGIASAGGGSTVLGAWLVLAISRTWAAQSNWLDRAGRILGFCWIFAYFLPLIAHCVRPWVEHLIPSF